MGKQVSYLIIGNGIAGITAAETLRSIDRNSDITIVADDPFPVYYRPALKDFLGGRIAEENLWARPNTFYQKQRVKFVPGRVARIDPMRHFVQLQSGELLEYSKLLLANGARPRQLDCPGLDLAGVSTLRTFADYQEVLRRLPTASRVVVYGSGTLALESAETLRHRDYAVTHLLRNQVLWSEVLDATASDMVLQEERRTGIDVRTGETIAEVVGKRGQVTTVLTTSGTRIPCDLLLIAIGIAPNIDFIQASGIACSRGVKVDAAMRTNAPDIYAAGDVIETTDVMTGRTRVLGQWFPAIQQARTAAYSMLDQLDSSKPGTFYNATFLNGLDFVSIGVTLQPERLQYYQEIVAEPAPHSYRKVLLKDGIPVGALLLGDRQHALSLKRAIDHRVNLTPILGRLFADDFRLDDWLDKQNIQEAIFESNQHTVPNKNTVTSAYLVPIPDSRVAAPVKETPLNANEHNNLIGRQTGATLYIEHSSVSRRHAEISFINGQYILRDMGSSNGTFVNNVALPSNKTRALHQDDKVRFGDVQFRFQLRARSSSKDVQNIGMHTGNIFQHIQNSQLHNDTTRNVPTAILAEIKDQPSFVVLTKDAHPRTLPVPYEQFMGKRLTIGRDRDNTIVLNDTAASRQHAEIFGAPDGFYIRDLNSSNGVFVNNVKISNPYHLANEDRVVIGNTLLYCSFPQSPGQAVSSRELSPPPTVKTRVLPVEKPGQATSKHPIVVGLGHRTDIQALSDKHLQFEIDMCIGCDRCMAACPIPMSSTVRIADLNQATVSDEVAPNVTRFTHECIMCGSCVPVCPVDNHRDLLMLSLKQRLGVAWDGDVDVHRVTNALPPGWSVPLLINRLREQPIFSDPQLVPESYLLHLFASSQLLALEAGATLLREGEYGRDLYFLLEGRLSVSTLEVGNKELQIAIINRGEYTGEYGMLTGQPHHTTVRTMTPILVLQVPEQVMQHLMELVPQARHFFEQLNNARSIEGILKRMALFQGISDADIRALVEQTRVQQYDRDECLFTEGDKSVRRTASAAQTGRGRPARETLHILLEGFVKVSRLTTAGTGHNKSNERIIAYRQGGDYFAGGLDLLGDGRAATVSAITRTRVAEVPRTALLSLFKRYPEVNQRFTMRLREYIESSASAQSVVFEESLLKPYVPQPAPADSTVRAGLHSLISDGVVEGTEVLIIDLDKCIHCNECEEACERRYGHSRMNRQGMVVENISIATACRQCQDPVCMLCSRAGIARRPNGEVYITESCIGCGICAERCPYGAISIVSLNPDSADTASWTRFSNLFAKGNGKERARKYLPMANETLQIEKHVTSGPLDFSQSPGAYDELRKKIAIKCDLCAAYSDQACVQACPTGAAIRVQPTKFFGSTEEILRRRAR